MKRIKRIMMLMLSLILVLGVNNLAFGVETTNNENIKAVVEKYFDNYYKSFKQMEIVNSDDVIEDNDSTYLYKTLQEFLVEGNKAVGLYYKDYKVNIDYKKISISNNNATVEARVHLDYFYSTTPDIKSSFTKNYSLNLIMSNNKWKINAINSNSLEVNCFKDLVKANVKQGFSIRDAINKAKNERMNEIRETKKYIDGSSAKIKDKEIDYQVATAGTFSYNKMLGRNYAQRFAEADEWERFFYTAGSTDCTNFVSQCVWAAYGGYVEGNDTQTINNISNKVRMVNGTYSTGWFGGSSGGASKWESVNNFWSYAISSKTYGPKGTGSNNGNPYYNLSPSAIIYGNVLQFRDGSSGGYTHSTYVTYTPSSPQYYSDVLISYHSDDHYNKNLWEVITYFGGNNCYMRKISFSSAQFSN